MLISQKYESYTNEDQEVWSTLFRRQSARLENRVCAEYHTGLDALGLTAEMIPCFDDLNLRLQAVTGWRLAAVDGALTSREFFELVHDRVFPSATTLRGKHELGHSKLLDGLCCT